MKGENFNVFIFHQADAQREFKERASVTERAEKTWVGGRGQVGRIRGVVVFNGTHLRVWGGDQNHAKLYIWLIGLYGDF